MSYLRWYDKDEYLSAFAEYIQSVDRKIQSKIVLRILDEISDIKSQDLDEFIKYVEENDPKQYNRWYDENPYFHSVFEDIKHLSEDERKELYKAIAEIVKIHTGHDLGKHLK